MPAIVHGAALLHCKPSEWPVLDRDTDEPVIVHGVALLHCKLSDWQALLGSGYGN